MDQGATNGGKRLLRYHSNNNRGGDEDNAEERGIFDFERLKVLTNLARSNEANNLDFRLKDFFQALINAKVNPSNIHHTRLDQDDYLELRQLFRTWYNFYHRTS
ncbi:Crystallin J1C [Phytophthora nicotianae]|nr:Crystallin J1C [Phytophthora nicotianae]